MLRVENISFNNFPFFSFSFDPPSPDVCRLHKGVLELIATAAGKSYKIKLNFHRIEYPLAMAKGFTEKVVPLVSLALLESTPFEEKAKLLEPKVYDVSANY